MERKTDTNTPNIMSNSQSATQIQVLSDIISGTVDTAKNSHDFGSKNVQQFKSMANQNNSNVLMLN